MSLHASRKIAVALAAAIALTAGLETSALALPATLHSAAAAAAVAGPQREVFGFVNAGALGSSQTGYQTWNFNDLSTVAFFGLHVNAATGAFASDSDWTVWNSADIPNLLAAAHTPGHYVKVVLTIIFQDFTTDQSGMCAALGAGNANIPATTLQKTVQEVQAKHADGVNVDYEGLNHSCASSNTAALLTQFVANLRTALAPPAYLSVDTYGESAVDPGGFYNVTALAHSVDSFFVMAYPLDQSNHNYNPPGCSGYCLSPVSPTTGPYHWNDAAIAAQYASVVPPSQVILGVPYFGVKSCVAPYSAPAPPGPNAIPTSDVAAPAYLDSISDSSQQGVTQYTRGRDTLEGLEVLATWKSTTWNCWRESYWDDTFSLGHKYDIVNQAGLRGIGIFTLDYGGGAPELWDLLAQKFSNTVSLGGRATGGPAAASWGAGRLDLFVRGADNQLWHQWNAGGGWNVWEPLGGVLSSSPAAVAWGQGRLDVFVRGADAQLWHRWFVDGSGWSNWEPLGGVLGSAPAAASWAAGRLDVFAQGGDGQLWHRWWAGSGWSSWEPLGGRLAGDPGAVSWGVNRIDVLVRGPDGALWHRWWDGAAWRGWEGLGGAVAYGAGVTSRGSGELDAFVTGTDGATWRNSWMGGGWTGWQWTGGYWTSAPALASAGSGIDLFARGRDGAVWEVALAS